MNPAPNIKKAGNAPGGNRLLANFPGPDYPDFVQVKGTSDKRTLEGNSGNWISGNKYTSAAITLQLIKGGVVVQEDAYDASGNLANPDATLTSAGLILSSLGNDVDITWTTVKESGVSFFIVDRKLSSATVYDPFIFISPNGPGSLYDVTDSVPSAGTFNYRLRALFTNGTDKVLDEKSITIASVPVPNAVADNFALSKAGATVTISWTATVEVSVTRYEIDRKLSASAVYDPAIALVSSNGQGYSYSIDDSVPAAGSYDYQLRAVFDNGTGSAPLAHGTITV